jgi:geranylgeranyl pyrophosphate synthase
MDKQKYIDYLNDTSAQVSPFILEILQQYAELDAELYDGIMFLVSRRLGKPLLKPALLRATYELCGGKDWENIIPACAAFELINISSYQANSAFDNKLGVLTKNQKDTQFIASMATREVAEECLAFMHGTFDRDMLANVADCLSLSNKYIYTAQHWDINLLTLANKERYATPDYFIQEYTKRCHYGSGVFTGQCAYSGALLAGADTTDLEAMRRFGESYGTALHMINDLGDYVPGDPDGMHTRDYQDQYSDLRNRRLTLPLFLLLRKLSDGSEYRMAERITAAEVQKDDLLEVTRMLIRHGIGGEIRREVSGHIKQARDQLRPFSKNPARWRLKLMLSIGRSNKYYGLLRRLSPDAP